MKRVIIALVLAVMVIAGLKLWMGNANNDSVSAPGYNFKKMETILVGVDVPEERKKYVDPSLMEIVYPIVQEEYKVEGLKVLTPDKLEEEWQVYAKEHNIDALNRSQMATYVAEKYRCSVLGVNIMSYMRNGGKSTVIADMVLIDPMAKDPLVWQAEYIYENALGDKEKLLREVFRLAGKDLRSKRK